MQLLFAPSSVSMRQNDLKAFNGIDAEVAVQLIAGTSSMIARGTVLTVDSVNFLLPSKLTGKFTQFQTGITLESQESSQQSYCKESASKYNAVS